MALGIGPGYVIEVLAEKYDHLSREEKTKTLIHELLHIPSNFSGSLLPHRGRGRTSIDTKTRWLYDQYFPRR
jgi:predicted metallopeptidase